MLHDSDQKVLNDFQTHSAINKNKKNLSSFRIICLPIVHTSLYYKSSLNWNRRIKCAAKWLTSTLRAFIIWFDEWMSRNIAWFAGYFIESRWSSYKKRARDQLLICQKHCSCGWFIIRWDLYFLESLSWNCFLLCVRFYTSS